MLIPANARCTGNPSPSNPRGAVVTDATGRSVASSGSGTGIVGRVDKSLTVTAGIGISYRCVQSIATPYCTASLVDFSPRCPYRCDLRPSRRPGGHSHGASRLVGRPESTEIAQTSKSVISKCQPTRPSFSADASPQRVALSCHLRPPPGHFAIWCRARPRCTERDQRLRIRAP